jgi:uncharacterized protein (TIGR02266 family)
MPNSVRALFGLAETLLARSERAEPLVAAADQQRAAEVFFHLAQRVPPSDATPYLQRVLLVAPGHTQARTMLESLARRSNAERHADRPANEGDAWLPELDPKGDIQELSSSEQLPIDEASRLSTPSGRPSNAPATLASGPAPAQKREPAPAVAAAAPAPSPQPARPAPPTAAPAHPKISLAPLPDDPNRVSLEVNIGSTTDSNFYVDASEQLIDGGVFVATYSPLSEGTQTTLTLTLPGKVVARAYGRVVLTRDLMDAFHDHIPGMGVEFERVDARSFALIERFARKRTPTFLD